MKMYRINGKFVLNNGINIINGPWPGAVLCNAMHIAHPGTKILRKRCVYMCVVVYIM